VAMLADLFILVYNLFMFEKNNLQEEWDYWFSRVYAYFYKRVDGKQYEVEELTSLTMNAAFLAENIKNFKGYIWRVAHNQLVQYIKTKKLEPILVPIQEEIDDNQKASFFIDWEAENLVSSVYQDKLESLKSCIKKQIIKPDEKEILEFTIYDNKKSTEIASILGIKSDNVRQKLSRTLKKIKLECLELWQILNPDF
jgi:RNA polymerase sigma factor (sigma-70 family)